MKIALHIEYDGTAYSGLQVQPDRNTIQSVLEDALKKLYQAKLRMTASGRTDAGVHAMAQIIHYEPPRQIPALNIIKALNSFLPADIRIMKAAEVDDDFHARFSAIKRDYIYKFHTRPSALERLYSWHLRQNISAELLTAYAEILPGEKDFETFCSTQADVDHYFCSVTESTWEFKNEHLLYRISANRFLHSMVRSLVGTMVTFSLKRRSPQEFKDLLARKKRGPEIYTAPPMGLYLMNVHYDKAVNWVTL
ncbi:MAG: tRNA pseudouridine(38-40) synthase TruA [Candidatus Marinimicrobia bacterium]|nr:tRNA pseudouridine(38-40) synthase TruA [Candidatus Neomarinimicrobiota bacterium]